MVTIGWVFGELLPSFAPRDENKIMHHDFVDGKQDDDENIEIGTDAVCAVQGIDKILERVVFVGMSREYKHVVDDHGNDWWAAEENPIVLVIIII